MLELRRQPDLALKPLGAERRGELRVQDLERDGAIVLVVDGEIDRGHAAATELALDPVFASETLAQAI